MRVGYSNLSIDLSLAKGSPETRSSEADLGRKRLGDYLWWPGQDRKTLKCINALLQDIARNGNEGIGKPESLRHGLNCYWSRRITDEHRLVYKISGDQIRHRGRSVPL